MQEAVKNIKKYFYFLVFTLLVLPSVIKAEPNQTIYNFEYSGSVQEWIAPTDGVYLFETWGAQGGYRSTDNAGRGGYTKGYVYAKKGDRFYVYVGGSGKTHKGYNGGGSRAGIANVYGGGATDIRFNTDSLYSRLIVAGGGGTDGSDRSCGGSGGLTGDNACSSCGSGGNGATITGSGANRGEFGIGGNGLSGSGGYAGAGGGGWYGGGGANPDYSGDDDRGGGGGSSFTFNEGTKSQVPNGYTVPDRLLMYNFSYSTGARAGDGLARITTIEPDGIESIKLSSGTTNININYNYKLTNYTITVDNSINNVLFNVTPKEGYSIAYSQRNLDISSTTGTQTITVTHNATGIVKVYTVTINQVNHYLVQNGSSVYYDIPYTGEYQEFYIPSTGTWTLELWGAQGGSRRLSGGNGGYTVADVDFSAGQKLYLYVGGSGNTVSRDGRTKGWNGGGHSYYTYTLGGFYNSPTNAYGGGATDIRIDGTTLYNRLIVAAGGGAAGASGTGGAACLAGGRGCGSVGAPGGSTAGGSVGGTFGVGGAEIYQNGGYGGAGGGGWYGGGRATPDHSGDDDSGGGGGSGFIWNTNSAGTVPAGYKVSNKFYMTNGFIHTGGETFKNPNGGSETGHTGNGYIRLTPKLLNGIDILTINGGNIPIDFDFTKYDYTLTVPDDTKYINVNALIADGFSINESYSGNYDFSDINNKEYTYTLDVINDVTKLKKTYKITFRKASYYWQAGTAGSYGYGCTKDVQEFVAPAAGIYTVEAWGAQGQSTGAAGGNGSYAKGNLFLSKGERVYIYVGCSGANGGYNGGGDAYWYRDGNQNVVIPWAIRGGGASDIRLGGNTTYHRVLVAAGGGGAGAAGTGGPGDSVGNNSGCGSQGNAATMSNGGDYSGTWAVGAQQYYGNGGYVGPGGGGWYGGGTGRPDGSANDEKGGGGGSSYIWSKEYASFAPSNYEVSTNHYLFNPVIIKGNETMPDHNGTSTMVGNAGDGYVRFDFSLSYKYKINVSDNVTLDKKFDYDTKEYIGTVDNTSSVVDFEVDLTDDESVLTHSNDGRHEIHVGENNYPISVTYVNGAVDIFNYSISREANDIDILNDIKINEEPLSKYGSIDFSSDNYEYTITLPYTLDEYDLNITKGSADQTFDIYTSSNTELKYALEDSIAHIQDKNNTYDLVINVENETHTSSKTYTIHVTLPHSSKMKKFILESSTGKQFEYEIEEGKEVYNIELESYVAAVNASAELFDGEATVSIDGDGYIQHDIYTIVATVSEPHVEPTNYIFNIKRISIGGYEKGVSYTGTCQSFVVPYSHEYLLEAWGAQGGRGGGRGGYSYGTIYLEKGTQLYLCAGGSGDNGGFNGGGTSRAGYGGGASDIRLGQNSLYSRILIAGGGGGHGSDGCAYGAVGGGINGGGKNGQGSCGTNAGGGTQTSGGTYGITGSAKGNNGKFAQGAAGPNSGGGYYGGGGGGGFYGGGSGATAGWSSGGGGGSGFIYNEESYALVTDPFSDEFSGGKWLVSKDYLLEDAHTFSGSEKFTTTDHQSTELGHPGNGYVKVSIPYQKSENNYLAGIISDYGTFRQDWDYNRTEYDLDLNSKDTQINIEGVPADRKASVAGNGDYLIKAENIDESEGVNEILITVTSESGDIKEYVVHVHRPIDHNPYPNTINVDGLIETYCALGDYCHYSFDKETDTYTITVPYQVREINITVDKAHYYQDVTGDGIYRLDGGLNQMEIHITAEDKTNEQKYYFNIYRDMSGNADLDTLAVINPETALDYSYNVTDYYIVVDNETENIEVQALADDPNATVYIDNVDTLDYGLTDHNKVVVTVISQDETVTKTYTIHVTRLKSNDSFLGTLNVYDITNEEKELALTPSFSKGVTEYNLNVDNDTTKIRIDATPANQEFSTLTGNKEYDLNVGRNTLSVIVTAQDGSNLTYNINVNRAANSNALLSNLEVFDKYGTKINFTESFNKDKFGYYIYVPATVESISIDAIPEELTTKWSVVTGDTKYLTKDKNIFTVRAVAEDNSYNDYQIIVVRTPYEDNDLLSLTVTNGNESFILTPEFSPVLEEYTLNVENYVESVKVTAIANKNERALIGSNYMYQETVNLLNDNPYSKTIAVTSEDGVVHNYTITINREKSSDNTLKSLTVENNVLTPEFNSDTLEYNITTFAHELNIEAIPNNKYAKVEISDTKLNPGMNEIIIKVTSETNEVKEYKLNVEKVLDTNANITNINVSTGYTPEFAKDVFEYTSTTHGNTANISATLESEWATYKVVDDLENDYTNMDIVLNVGENIFYVKSTSEDQENTLIYKITIIKELNKNPNVANISLSNTDFVFNSEEDTFEVNTHAKEIDVSATMEDSEFASYKIFDGDNQEIDSHIAFEKGQSIDKVIIIRGYAEDQSITKDYKITIRRTPNDNANIKDFGIQTTKVNAGEEVIYMATTDETKLDLSKLELEDEWASFEVEGNENFTVNGQTYTVYITVTAEDNTTQKEYRLDVTKLMSTDPKLKEISINNQEIIPEFNADTLSYVMYLDNEITTLDFKAITLKDTARITSIKLNEDELITENVREFNESITIPSIGDSESRIITITTLAEDEIHTLTYTLTIKSSDEINNNLGSLQTVYKENGVDVVNSYTPEFNKDTLEYSIQVPTGVSTLTIAAIPEVTISTVEGADSYTFKTGEHNKDIQIVVTPKVGEAKTYTIHVEKLLSTESRIESLTFKNENIEFDKFDKDIFEYKLNVSNDVKELTLEDLNITMVDEGATSILSPCKLKSTEENVCTLYGVAEDGTKSAYKFNITREKGTESRLKMLSFGEYKFDEGEFMGDLFSYTLRVPKSKQTIGRSDLTYELEDEEATISFPATMNLDFSSNDNNYVITVTASDGVTQSFYRINVTHILSNDNTIKSYRINDEKINVTAEQNAESSPILTYGLYDDETSTVLSEIELNNEDGSHDASLPVTINVGKDYLLNVTSESGIVKVYTFKAIQDKTKKLDLNKITVSVPPSFDCEGICTLDRAFDPTSDDYNYEMTVPFGVNFININVEQSSQFQSYEIIGNEDFKTGDNPVIIRVYNSLGESRDYTINVVREPSHDANLRKISFETPELEILDYAEDIYEYNVEFSQLESGRYDLAIEKKDEGQSYRINGAQVLYFGGNDIYVDSYSETCFSDTKSRYGCEQRQYLIHAHRYKNWSNLLNSITVSTGNSGNLLQDFTKFKYDYILQVPSEVSQIKIESVAAASDIDGNYHATIEGNGDFQLAIGLNKFNLVVTPEDGGFSQTYTINIVRSASDNVNLLDLSVTDKTMTPAFDKSILDYYVDVDEDTKSLDIKYVKETPESTVHINGNSNFVTGDNIVSVIVLSADKTRGKTYKIHAVKGASTNNFLEDLKAISLINGEEIQQKFEPKFNKETNDYVIHVDKYTDNIRFDAKTEHMLATVMGDNSYALDYGDNDITISVTSESGLVNDYNIKVIREHNLNINDLSVKDTKVYKEYMKDFNKDTLEYNITVPFEVDEVEIDGTLEELSNTVEGFGLYNLKTGNNTIEITVNHEGVTGTYTINIYREKNNDSKLLSLEVEEGALTPEFSSDNHSYLVEIPYEYTYITPIYTLSDSITGHVEILNNGNLEVNVPRDVTVRSYAENETYTDYVITVTRTDKSKSSNYLENMYLEELPFNEVFIKEKLNYTADVDKTQARVVLHIKPESTYSKLEVYKSDQSDIVRKLDAKAADPNTTLTLTTGKNTYIVRVTNEEGLIRNYKIDIYRNGASEARIKTLEFDHGTIAPVFDKNNTNYTITLDNQYKRLEITNIVMVDPHSTYEITGNKRLQTGDNIVTITTTSEDREAHMTYVFRVNRKKSDNAYLALITTFPEYSEEEWNFDKEKYQYNLEIEPTVSSVQVIGVREDTSATITGNGIYQITKDVTPVNLVVTSESGIVTRTYTVNIIRKKDNNNYLRQLTTNNGELVPEFDKTVQSYTIEVENEVDSITLNGVAESQTSKVVGNVNNKAIAVGENKFAITVTSQDGQTRVYNINVIRKEKEVNKLELASLSIKEGELTPAFAPSTLNYIVTIPNEYESATITYTTNDENAIVKIIGNENFVVGHNDVQVLVLYNDEELIYHIDVIRQEASNTYLMDLSVIGYTLTPEFDKNTQDYELNVPNNVSSINTKALVELATSKVYFKLNEGEYTLSNGYNNNISLINGTNYLYYKVMSNTNAQRIYRIKINREVSDENLLLSFSPSTGTITPEFNSNVNSYVINVPIGTKTIKFTGTYSKYATQSGLNTQLPVTLGETTRFVTITSQSGRVNTYEFKIIREPSHNANITNIKPSTGKLTPTFNINTEEYEMTVEGDVNTISYNVTTEDANATVTGNTNNTLSSGNNTIVITSTAEDGINKKIVTIKVYKKIDIQGIEIDDEIDIPIGEEYPLEVGFVPNDTDYKGLTYSAKDLSILTVNAEGVITPKVLGSTLVTITSTRRSSVTKTIKVNVIQPKILSDVYYINRDMEYISGFDPKVKIEEFISNLKNEKSWIHVYDKDGNQVEEDDNVSTMKVVKLEINGKVYDQLTLVLKGDIDGDGSIIAADVTLIKNHVSKKIVLDQIQQIAADIDCDNHLVAGDVTNIKNYVSKKSKTLNTKVLAKINED